MTLASPLLDHRLNPQPVELPEPLPDFPLTTQNIFLLDDFTTENGATQVVPGSHKTRKKPEWKENTDAAPVAGRQVLAGRSIEESHRPQRLESDWSVGYCLAWRANRFADHIYHGHGGGIYGYASQILFSKSHQLGVICLANVWPHAGLLDLARDLLDRAIAARRPLARRSPSSRSAVPSMNSRAQR